MTDSLLNKRIVYALGETVLDLVSEGGFTFRAVPGGSMLNAAVSLGRMGVDVELISEFGDDKAGNLIGDFLNTNAVQSGFCVRHADYNTSLALAFLDSAKNATYTFYHDSPEKLKAKAIPAFRRNDVLLFGSFYAVKPDRRDFILRLQQKAIEAGAVLFYDLNIRKAHIHELADLMPSFMNNIAASAIVKGSDEDFFQLLGLSDLMAIYEKVSPYCKILILTQGSKPAEIFTPVFHRKYKVPEIQPVSTIGAGDNFNAGFLYGLVSSGLKVKTLSELPAEEMDRMVACGLAFATETCLSTENYISGKFEPDFWKKYI